MNHPRSDLIIVVIAERIVGFVDALGQESGDKLSLHTVEADGSRLVKLGRLLFFVLLEQQGIQIIFQLCMEAVIITAGMVDIVFNPSIYIGMADGIPNIMSEKTADIGEAGFPLLPGLDSGKLGEAAAEKIIDQMFMRVGTDIAVIPMPQNRQVVKEDVRSLESKPVSYTHLTLPTT